MRSFTGISNYKTRFTISKNGNAVGNEITGPSLVGESNEHFAEVLAEAGVQEVKSLVCVAPKADEECARHLDYTVTFSTRPLSTGTWEPVPFTSLVAVKDGEIVRTSPPHGNEYIYNPEDYRLVYMNFARL